MNSKAYQALLVLAGLLVGIILLEYGDRPSEKLALIPFSHLAAAEAGAAGTPADQTPQWAATMLGRPLFSPSRRGSAQVTRTGTAGLPRLSAILITDTGRSAIFAASAGGKPIVASEGSRIGNHRVKSIEADEVIMVGPEGTIVLRTSFAGQSGGPASNKRASPRPAAATGGLSLLDQLRLRTSGGVAIPGLPAPAVPMAPAAGP